MAAKCHLSLQSGNRNVDFYLYCRFSMSGASLLKYYLFVWFVTISLLLLLLKKTLQSYTATSPARMNWYVAACPSPRIELDGTKKIWYVIDFPCTTLRMLEIEICSHQNREGGVDRTKQQTNQFTQDYNILHRLQLHHLTLTFIVHNYIYEYYYLYTYSQLY